MDGSLRDYMHGGRQYTYGVNVIEDNNIFHFLFLVRELYKHNERLY